MKVFKISSCKMYKKSFVVFVISLVFTLVSALTPVFAQNPKNSDDDETPERDGTYDVPGRPGLKVRVFVHNPKLAKPTDSLSLICNLPDPDSIATVSPAGWRLPAGVWTYLLNTSSVPASVGSANLPNISADAFGRWSTATSGKVVFSRGPNTTIDRKGLDGKNIIAWGRTSGTALGVTYIWYYPATGLAAEMDTIMNKKFSWSWTPYATDACVNSSTYDAQDILTHELGHWIGLNDMYDGASFQHATMYGYGAKGEIKKDTLTTGDAAGVAAIYP